MKASEATRLAKKHGCQFKAVGYGMFKVIRSPDNWGFITKAEFNRTNEAKFVSFYVPEQRG